MKKFTKKQRYEIYNKALVELAKHETVGMCPNIAAIAFDSTWKYSKVTKELFPELFLFEPQEWATQFNWVEEGDDFTRETILMFCIEMTK